MTKPCILKLSHKVSCMHHRGQIMGPEAQVKSAEQSPLIQQGSIYFYLILFWKGVFR